MSFRRHENNVVTHCGQQNSGYFLSFSFHLFDTYNRVYFSLRKTTFWIVSGFHLHQMQTGVWLTTLNIFLSRIQDIPPTAFQDLHSLEWIKLYNNLLTTLHYELMEPVLDSLQHIDIHSKCFWFITCIIDDKKFNAKTIWLRHIEFHIQ